jgi:Sep-tRNA:Cys-tRNA synthetase
VAQAHKKRGFFLSGALGEKGVAGIIPGATRVWKFNTYGMTKAQAQYLAQVFVTIAQDNGLAIA